MRGFFCIFKLTKPLPETHWIYLYTNSKMENNNTSQFKCILFDLNNPLEEIEYKEPIYTKRHGVYGYLTVSLMGVHFIEMSEGSLQSDDVSDLYRVEYRLSKEIKEE